jgi:hypothetical protein
MLTRRDVGIAPVDGGPLPKPFVPSTVAKKGILLLFNTQKDALFLSVFVVGFGVL